MTPSHAFVLLILGVLAIYCEFIRPGRIFPILAGSALAVIGSYFLWRNSPTRIGLVLAGVALALFAAEALSAIDLVFGILGVISLTAASRLLFDNPHRIPAALGVPVSLLFGAITVFLSRVAKRARRNKAIES